MLVNQANRDNMSQSIDRSDWPILDIEELPEDPNEYIDIDLGGKIFRVCIGQKKSVKEGDNGFF